jgi:hypothetical protein
MFSVLAVPGLSGVFASLPRPVPAAVAEWAACCRCGVECTAASRKMYMVLTIVIRTWKEGELELGAPLPVCCVSSCSEMLARAPQVTLCLGPQC